MNLDHIAPDERKLADARCLERMVCEWVFGMDEEDTNLLTDTVDESTLIYFTEIAEEEGIIDPIFLNTLGEIDDEMENGSVTYGWCAQMRDGKGHVITINRHDLLTLAHEITHAHIDDHNIEEDQDHGHVFWRIHERIARRFLAELR